MPFKLISNYKPTGDQPKAIGEISSFLKKGYKYQTMRGVTGSGKTFTMANIIEKIQKPTLVIAHNKTLAAQLAQEFKEFFPENAVHYFVSYYDYYQPEAYIKKTDTYIEKEATINEEIDRLRHAATQSLLTRKDVIIVASVSCIYGIGDINAYISSTFDIKVGNTYKIEEILDNLISMQYRRATSDFKPGTFKVLGDVLEIFPSSEESIFTIEFWGDELTRIMRRNYLTGEIYEDLKEISVFPAKHTVTTKNRILEIIPEIRKELAERLVYFQEKGDILKYERLKTKVEYDIEMMQEVGYVNGIENYSRYLDGRKSGVPPATLIDYFGDDFLCFIDESHMTVPQIGGMYAGDRSRKENLVENGFRLSSALDNRPLKFDEFESKMKQVIFVSATPSEFEINNSIDGDINKLQINKLTNGRLLEISKSDSFLIKADKGILNNQEKNEIGAFEYFKNFDPLIDGNWISSEKNRVVEQVIRPTGLLDPEIEIKAMEFMIDDVIKNLDYVIEKNERMLITTLTKRSSEELTDYLIENGYKVRYLHSEVETLERLEILKMLRTGEIDIIVGVNLLREGLDLPEVSRIAILDADKQGFLRSASSLVQIIGRASRNSNGKVVMYTEKLKKGKNKNVENKEIDEFQTNKLTNGELEKFKENNLLCSETKDISNFQNKWEDKEGQFSLNQNLNTNDNCSLINYVLGTLTRLDNGRFINDDGLVISESMKKAIDLTYYRRKIQDKYNKKHNITPTTIYSTIKEIGVKTRKEDFEKLDKKSLEKEIKRLELEMDIASANLEFEKAAELRDKIIEIRKKN